MNDYSNSNFEFSFLKTPNNYKFSWTFSFEQLSSLTHAGDGHNEHMFSNRGV